MSRASSAATAAPETEDRTNNGVKLLKPAEAGEWIGASEDHVYRLIASGALRAVDIAQPGARRSKTRIRSDDLQAYIDSATRSTNRTSR